MRSKKAADYCRIILLMQDLNETFCRQVGEIQISWASGQIERSPHLENHWLLDLRDMLKMCQRITNIMA